VIFAEGAQNDVPLLAGWNKDEGFNFTLLQGADADRSYSELVGEVSRTAQKKLSATTPAEARSSIRQARGRWVVT